jgi:hypothetical protein
MRRIQHRHRRNIGQPLRGLGIVFSDLYEPSGEQARKLVALGLKTTWDNAMQYIVQVENGLIARNTGRKILDIGDFEIFFGSRIVPATSSILSIEPDTNGGYLFRLAYRTAAGQESNANTEFWREKRGYYTAWASGSGDAYSVTQSLANALTDDSFDRPASTYTQAAVANTYQTGATVQEQNTLLTQSLNDTNAAIKYQIEQDQKAFLQNAQNQANIIAFQNAYETAQENITQVQNQINDIYRIQNTADNNADLIYEAQRLEQERLRQLDIAKQAQQAVQIGTQNAKQYAQQEQQLQQQQWQQAQLDKLKQISANAQTGTNLQKQTATTAKTTLATTAAKPSTTSSSKPTSSSTARTEGEETPKDEPPANKFPLWKKVALGGLGAVAVAGGAYYLIIKQGKKGKSKAKKGKAKK